jgi:hypothetical protein
MTAFSSPAKTVGAVGTLAAERYKDGKKGGHVVENQKR